MVEPYAPGVHIEVDVCPKRPHQTARLLQSSFGPFPLLFIGLSDGTLRSYMTDERIDFIHWQTDHSRLYHTCCTFLDTWGVFITILKNRLTIYDLPLQQLDAGVAHDDTKGAVLFAVHEEAKTVCVLLQSNTLKVFDWTAKRNCNLRTQHQVPISVQQLVILSERHVFVQGKNKWIILNLDTGKAVHVADNIQDKIHDVLEGDTTSCDAVAVPSCNLSRRRQHVMDVLLCGKRRGVILSILEETKKNLFMEEAERLFPSFNDHLETSKDENEDKPLDMTASEYHIQIERILTYDATPRRGFYHHPFLLFDQVEQIAVYNFGTLRILQTIPVKGTFDLCAFRKVKTSIGSESSGKSSPYRDSFSTFLVSVSPPFNVQAHRMFSVAQLVATCLGNRLLQDAVALCKLCPEESPLSDAEQRKLYADYGFELFRSARRREAMTFFYESEIDVTEVLLLFPRNLLPRKISALWKDNIHSGKKDLTMDADEVVESLFALIQFLYRKRNIYFHPQEEHVSSNERHHRPHEENQALELIDTMLVKCLVVVSEKEKYQEDAKRALLEFVTGPNWCEISEAEVFLRAHRRFKALLAFYSARKLHRKALELLEDLERSAASVSETNEPFHDLQSSSEYLVLIAQYLRALDKKQTELVFEFSRRVMSVNPALGLSIFTQREVPNSKPDIDPVAVLQHLKSCSIAPSSSVEIENGKDFARTSLPLNNSHMLAIEYLTQLIYEGTRPLTRRLHDEVVYLLLDAIQAKRSSNERLPSRVDAQQHDAIGVFRRKLLEFLEFPGALYHPERMLSRTPIDMVDEHAALLSKLGRHREVLQLYALELKDAALAEAYCNRCYESKTADKSIYSTLLKIYLRPEEQTSRRVASTRVDVSPSDSSQAVHAAINLLNKYAERIEVSSALELLPGHVPVVSLTEFFRRVFEHQVARCRTGQIKTQLSKMANFTIREHLTTKRKQAVTIWMSQRCHVCGKKLGLGTFVRLANGNLLHYSCQPVPL